MNYEILCINQNLFGHIGSHLLLHNYACYMNVHIGNVSVLALIFRAWEIISSSRSDESPSSFSFPSKTVSSISSIS